MQLSLINHYDKQYSIKGLLGLNKKKDTKPGELQNNQFNIKRLLALNNIDPDLSLHSR